MKSSVLLSLVAVPCLALGLWACGGKEATVDRSGTTEGAQSAGKNDPAKTATGSTSGGSSSTNNGSTNNGSTTGTNTAPDCTYDYQSSSGGGGGAGGEYTCFTDHHYECTAGQRTVSCECTGKNGSWGPTGSCSCSDTGVTFDYDCTNACTLPDEVFAKCNVPVPPPPSSSGSQGSTSSSSGGQ